MTFIPTRRLSESGGLSALERFRMSPVYRMILKKKIKNPTLMVQSMNAARATLMEAAKNWVNNQTEEFCNAIIAKLIDSGLNRAIIDVIEEGSNCTVFLSDRIGRLSKEIFNIVSEIAEADLVSKPDDTHDGLFVFAMQAKPNVDFRDYTTKLLSLKKDVYNNKNESDSSSQRSPVARYPSLHSLSDPCFLPSSKRR